MKPKDEKLYETAKSIVYKQYKKPSAYRSGALIKKYKELGGNFIDDNKPKNLKRWFNEKWTDVNPHKNSKSYPVYRPTKRISNKTPLTINEIDKNNLKSQSKLKQKIKGKSNLPPFIFK